MKIALALYGAMAVVTFGRSTAQSEAWHEANCYTRSMRLASGQQCYEPYTLTGMFAGALWPLYWSWEAQS